MNLEELMASTPPMQQHALIKGFQAGAASRDAEIAELKELIRLIFESTPPYREDGSYVFTDAVIDKWKELQQ